MNALLKISAAVAALTVVSVSAASADDINFDFTKIKQKAAVVNVLSNNDFGPGTGAFWALALVTLVGLDLRRATAATKVMNVTSNATALLFFALGGKVVVTVGLAMGAGQIIGSTLGAREVVRRSPGFVRWFLIGSVGLTMVKLLWDQPL